MNTKYAKCKVKWDNIFEKEEPHVPVNAYSGNEVLDRGIQWVCDGTEKILDFGCGNGIMLFLCALNGTKTHIGIDLSEKGIETAQKRASQMQMGEFNFFQGEIDRLADIENSSLDAVILSNILDNLYPDNAEFLLKETARILKTGGKVLLKLNPYITEAQIKEWDIRIIKDNLLDDGLILWNNTTDEWRGIFKSQFDIHQVEDVYYPEYEQYNRMFRMTKRSGS